MWTGRNSAGAPVRRRRGGAQGELSVNTRVPILRLVPKEFAPVARARAPGLLIYDITVISRVTARLVGTVPVDESVEVVLACIFCTTTKNKDKT